MGLIAFTPTIEVKEVDIKDINRGMIDEEVRLDGVISDIAQSKSKTSYFLTINDGEAQIQLIIFESQVGEIQSRNIDIEDFRGHKVEVVGTVTQYNSEMELILSSGDSLRMVS
ncbi:MAG: exodeoxyribonuclease VII large subunit [Methanobrevibacter sp.]|nr:exodeoxyribonuclease VII large subunit [Methanobrevibacter sp.]